MKTPTALKIDKHEPKKLEHTSTPYSSMHVCKIDRDQARRQKPVGSSMKKGDNIMIIINSEISRNANIMI